MANENRTVLTILSRNIKLIRRGKSLTQEQLAEQTDLTVKYISHLERGLSFPSADTLDKLASALDVPVYRLFYSEDSNTIPRDVLKKELHKIIDELR